MTPTLGKRGRAAELLRLARAEFGSLRPGEAAMLRGAALGEETNLAQGDDERLTWNPKFEQRLTWDAEKETGSAWGCWETWGEHRRVRAGVVRWVCAHKAAARLVDPYGLILDGALVEGGLDLDGADVPFRLFFFGCALPDGVSLRDARTRTINLQGSFAGPITADGLRAKGDVNLRNGFRARGEVRLLGADIGGDLSCSGGSFDCAHDKKGNPVGKGRALLADRLRSSGGVFLRNGFRARGEVRLSGADIGGDLACSGGSFDCARDRKGNPVGKGCALNADGATVRGTLYLCGAAFEGGQACGTPAPSRGGVLDLAGARVGYLHDQASGTAGWLGKTYPPGLLLADFRYEAIHSQAPLDARRRLAWLALHDKTAAGYLPERERAGHFDPQPYRQLASVLRRQGRGGEANTVMVEAARKQGRAAYARLRAKNGMAWPAWIARMPSVVWENVKPGVAAEWGRLWRWVFRVVAGYGYRRWRPLLWMVGIIALGGVVFYDPLPGDPVVGRMQPTQSRALADWVETGEKGEWVARYPAFSTLAYSADTFLPLVNLNQEAYWTPRTWWVKRVYLPLHILGGWVVTTLFAVSFTGLVRGQERE